MKLWVLFTILLGNKIEENKKLILHYNNLQGIQRSEYIFADEVAVIKRTVKCRLTLVGLASWNITEKIFESTVEKHYA